MRRAFQIFKRDVHRLLHNPVALVITIGVCVIPSLYAWYNIAANWDPYGNTEGVKIAVANEDRGVENEFVGTLNAGDQTVDQLKQNHDLGWVFTDADEAEEGVRRGDYYAAIVIPETFSEKLTSMLTGEFEQPTLEYFVNEKKNAIAPKVTDTGAETVEEQINETFVATVSETLAKEADRLGVELDENVSSMHGGVLSHARAARDEVSRVREVLSGMTETIDLAKEGLSDGKQVLSGLGEETPSLTKALQQANGLLTDTRTAARDFGTSLTGALASGATQLGTASSHANAAVGTVAGVVSEAKLKVDIALSNAQAVIDANNDVIEMLEKIQGQDLISGAIADLTAKLRAQNDQMQQIKDGLQAQSDAVGEDVDATAGAVDALNTAIQSSVDSLGTMNESLGQDVLPHITEGLDATSSVATDLTGVAAGIEPVVTQSAGLLDQMGGLLDQTKNALGTTDTLLGDIDATLGQIETDLSALHSAVSVDGLADGLSLNADDVAEFMSAPALLTTKTVYPVENYGSGVTPFYTNLALWVGGFVLIAIYKLEVDGEGLGHISANEAYFGRWLLMVALGAVQALIVCVGDLALGIQCGHPALFVLAGMLISFVYVNIIYALALMFKHIGKALGVLLVIIQIPGSSGMYPIEMMPGFFQAIHPLLPFTYGINAMRETIGGMYGADYLINLGILCIFLAVALVMGVCVRPLLLNLNLLFDRELATTGVMIGEHDGRPRERFSLRSAMLALLDTSAYRRDVLMRGARFESRYPRRVKAGFVLVVGLPVVLFVLSSVLKLGIDGKLVLLTLWIVAIVATDAYLIALEYMRETLNTQARLTALSDEELRAEIGRAHGKGGEE